MNRERKIELLHQLENGLITLPEFKRLFRRNSAGVIYFPDPDKFFILELNEFVTKKQLNEYRKGLKTVMYLPDNGRQILPIINDRD